jgi:hypothetical protein
MRAHRLAPVRVSRDTHRAPNRAGHGKAWLTTSTSGRSLGVRRSNWWRASQWHNVNARSTRANFLTAIFIVGYVIAAALIATMGIAALMRIADPSAKPHGHMNIP